MPGAWCSRGEACPFPTARLALNGGNGGDAREVEQYKEEETVGGERCLRCCLGIAVTVGLLQVGSHLLLQDFVFSVFIVVILIIRETVVVAVEHAHC